MESTSILAYVDACLPGKTPAERLEHARRLGLALELRYAGGVATYGPADLAGVEVATVQAYGLHDDHALHPDPARRAAGAEHVRAAIGVAESLGARRVLVVCGFGAPVVDAPFERCLEFFAELTRPARDAGVRLLVETLSPRRAGAFTDPGEVRRLLAALEAPDVFVPALDTGHLLDSGRDPEHELGAAGAILEELQLRGPDSTAPGPDLPLERWLRRWPPVVAVEHREPLPPSELDACIARIRLALAR